MSLTRKEATILRVILFVLFNVTLIILFGVFIVIKNSISAANSHSNHPRPLHGGTQLYNDDDYGINEVRYALQDAVHQMDALIANDNQTGI